MSTQPCVPHDEEVAALFERHRASLMGLAYRMLGSLAEAQDVAQETYLRFRHAVRQEDRVIESAAAYLHKIAGRLCLDQLKSARSRRETYVGTWLPEPIVEDSAWQLPAAARTADISFALMMTMDLLTPPERAAFLLHDVFELPFSEVAEAIAQNEAACRQLAARARRRLNALPTHAKPADDHARALVQTFLVAAGSGNVEAMRNLLANEAILYSDGGGKVLAARKPVYGADRICRFYAGLSVKYPLRGHVQVRVLRINGMPGAVVAVNNEVIQTFALQFDAHERIEAIYSTRNPEKLRGLAVMFETHA